MTHSITCCRPNVARVSGDAADRRRRSDAASAQPALLGGASPTGNAGEAAPHCADAKRPRSAPREAGAVAPSLHADVGREIDR